VKVLTRQTCPHAGKKSAANSSRRGRGTAFWSQKLVGEKISGKKEGGKKEQMPENSQGSAGNKGSLRKSIHRQGGRRRVQVVQGSVASDRDAIGATQGKPLNM